MKAESVKPTAEPIRDVQARPTLPSAMCVSGSLPCSHSQSSDFFSGLQEEWSDQLHLHPLLERLGDGGYEERAPRCVWENAHARHVGALSHLVGEIPHTPESSSTQLPPRLRLAGPYSIFSSLERLVGLSPLPAPFVLQVKDPAKDSPAPKDVHFAHAKRVNEIDFSSGIAKLHALPEGSGFTQKHLAHGARSRPRIRIWPHFPRVSLALPSPEALCCRVFVDS